MINPIPDAQVPGLIAALVAGVLWVAAVPLAAGRLLKRPPLAWSLPACAAAAGGLVYLDLPAWVPFVETWFATPVAVTALLAALAWALRRT